MTSPIIPAGFNGPVNESDEANRFALNTPRFVVASSTDLTPTAVTTSDRTVSVAPGAATCCGVYAAMATAQSVTFAVNGSASVRVDLVVLRWTWGRGAGSGGVPSVALGVVQGTPGAGAPAPVRTPGTLYEAVLAAVVINPSQGGLTPASVNDIRTYGGIAGPLVIPQLNYYTVVDVPVGGELAIGSPLGARYRRAVSGFQRVSDGLAVGSFTGAFLGTAYTPGIGTLFHDVGTATLAVGAGSSAVFAFPRTYAGIITMQVTPGDNNAGLGIVVPILTNMSVSSGFNGVVYTQTGGGITAGAAVRLNYDLWGWTNP
jgi:hypothetical protein